MSAVAILMIICSSVACYILGWRHGWADREQCELDQASKSAKRRPR